MSDHPPCAICNQSSPHEGYLGPGLLTFWIWLIGGKRCTSST